MVLRPHTSRMPEGVRERLVWIMSASADALSCAVSVLRRKLARIGQILAPKKCEVLAGVEASPVVRLWRHAGVAEFVRSRRPPEATLAERPWMPSSPSLLVLGAHMSLAPS